MAKNTNISDIDAQIAALKKQKKAALAAEKAAKKKDDEKRQLLVGSTVETVLGQITDIEAFKKTLKAHRELFVKSASAPQQAATALGEKAELPLPKQPEVAADEEPNIDLF